MRILIVTPQVARIATGNRCSAEQWERLLGGLGHEVEIRPALGDLAGETPEILVALNASRSHPSVIEFQEKVPDGKVIAVLTGTDIYPRPGDAALDCMRRADRLVLLQANATRQVPPELREKVRVIVQAAAAPVAPPESTGRQHFEIAVAAHFREVKDPLRTAFATRLLPADSRVRVRHAGAILEEEFEPEVRREAAENRRYEWLGELDPAATSALIAQSDLLVLSSLSEGAGRVVGEAVAAGTPVLSSRIDGVVGLLGDDYPGYFPVGDTVALAGLIQRVEIEPEFRQSLQAACRALAPQFDPQAETEAWRSLIEELTNHL